MSNFLYFIVVHVIIIALHSTLVLEVVMAYFLRKEKKKKGTYLQTRLPSKYYEISDVLNFEQAI